MSLCFFLFFEKAKIPFEVRQGLFDQTKDPISTDANNKLGRASQNGKKMVRAGGTRILQIHHNPSILINHGYV